MGQQTVTPPDPLIQSISGSLRLTLFNSRAFLHPRQIDEIATAIAVAVSAYLQSPNIQQAKEFGVTLCNLGLANEAVLGLGRSLREFHGASDDQVAFTVDIFHQLMVQGYIEAREAIVLGEQERIRSALQHTLHRHTLQLETAAEVARTATSTLDLGTLLTTAVDLIRERLNLDYIAVYLVDDEVTFAELRAATGAEGRRRLATRHRLKANGASTVARCLATRSHIVVVERSDDPSRTETSRLPWSQSEIVLPLVTHDKVVGVLSAQSKRSGVFSSQDVVGFQIMCDQLANAIENARLYASAQQRAEDLAQAYDQLKGLETLKDQFMQNVSHELRTPLTMIRGYTELLLMEENTSTPTPRVEALQVIMRNAEALTELVGDIMAMLEAGASRLNVMQASFNEAVQNSVTSFLYLAKEFDVTLVTELPSPEAAFDVIARQDHLRRIIDNLLGNAIKFTPPGGTITVQLRQEGESYVLQVIDNGIGIPPHLLKRIFERFYQVDSSRQRSHSGTGLGLALVKELVETYHGTVSAHSAGKDQGSVFTVTLPRAGQSMSDMLRQSQTFTEIGNSRS